VQSLSRSYPGGIARYRGLNHRLMALNPPGSLLIVVPKDLHPSWLEFDQQIYITVRTLLSANKAAKEPDPSHSKCSQLGFVLIQHIQDILFCNDHRPVPTSFDGVW